MAKLVVLLLIFNLLISTTITMAGGQNIPTDDVIKHPDMFFSHDRGYLIPGLGRGIKPKSKKGFNPFTYNPITGNNNGIPGFTDVPTFGGGSYLPGGDDVSGPNPPGFGAPSPNPGFEAPSPSPGGNGGFLGSARP